ncbi:MAG: FKBP-type peptidyl-prolyl cis-trans isomerase [Bifidobacteriaceae bacterium]|jgi:peptidylprolyl isomerase|nr:FKBP-type peptidyl-prolyl cis-trans isomerase [Bifidobacteriaceae bacterium]
MKAEVVKKMLRAATGGALAILLVAGCSGGKTVDDGASASASVSAEDLAIAEAQTWLDGVKWQAGADAATAPTLQFEAGYQFPDGVTVDRVVKAGDGTTIIAGHRVTVQWAGYDTITGEVTFSTYDEGQSPNVAVIADPTAEGTSTTDALSAFLVGQQVGVEMLIGYGVAEEGSEAESEVIALTVTDAVVPPTRASGTTMPQDDASLPTVTLDETTGQPSITTVATDPPTELVTEVLIQGDGAEVVADQSVVLQYTGWLWDGTQFDSSWTTGEPVTFTLTTGYLIQGFLDGLIGQKLGSQVLLVIPPDLGYGDSESNEAIPPGSTLIFVVDLLELA